MALEHIILFKCLNYHKNGQHPKILGKFLCSWILQPPIWWYNRRCHLGVKIRIVINKIIKGMCKPLRWWLIDYNLSCNHWRKYPCLNGRQINIEKLNLYNSNSYLNLEYMISSQTQWQFRSQVCHCNP